jgi:hypothetical protein
MEEIERELLGDEEDPDIWNQHWKGGMQQKQIKRCPEKY